MSVPRGYPATQTRRSAGLTCYGDKATIGLVFIGSFRALSI